MDLKVLYQGMKYFLTVFVVFYTFSVNAQILEPKDRGMNHIIVPQMQEEQGDVDKPPLPKEETTTHSDTKAYKPLPPFNIEVNKELEVKEALVPLKDLKGWKYINDLRSGSDNRINDALSALEEDLGAVPPTALFYAAEAYFAKGEKEKAALVYYLAQLRARFDFKRFPVKGDGTTRPQDEMTALSLMIGEKISPWVLSNTARTGHIFDLVEQTDSAVPYKYLPAFSLPAKTAPEDKWPELLNETRETYFTKTNTLKKALSAVKR